LDSYPGGIMALEWKRRELDLYMEMDL